MTTNSIERRTVRSGDSELAVFLQGDPEAPAVVMTHSILSSSVMWEAQAALLADQGLRVVRIDTRGHGDSSPGTGKTTMDQLVADTLAVFDALGLAKAHYVGLSLGGMSGFGLGARHGDRLLSMVLCDARADAPPAVANPWDERVAIAEQNQSCAPLAEPTLERWFGRDFLDANPATEKRFRETAAGTSVEGFVGCARAIQGLNYLGEVERIAVPSTFIVGAKDGVLPQAMGELQAKVPEARLEIIPNAGHLPNVDQPEAFNEVLVRHFSQFPA